MLIKSSTSDEEAKRLLRENGRASEFPSSSSSSSIASFAESVIVTETRKKKTGKKGEKEKEKKVSGSHCAALRAEERETT